MDAYEVRPHKDKRGVDLISEALPFGKLRYGGPNAADNSISYAKFYSRSKGAIIRVFDETGATVQERTEPGAFKEAS